jgi:hypothetical protein
MRGDSLSQNNSQPEFTGLELAGTVTYLFEPESQTRHSMNTSESQDTHDWRFPLFYSGRILFKTRGDYADGTNLMDCFVVRLIAILS